MKTKHFGRFVVTPEGVRLLDAETHAKETARKDQDGRASSVNKRFEVSPAFTYLEGCFYGKGVDMSAPLEAIKSGAEQEQVGLEQLQIVGLESSVQFLGLFRDVIDRLEPETQQRLMIRVRVLEEEGQDLAADLNMEAAHIFSTKVARLGREILAASNL